VCTLINCYVLTWPFINEVKTLKPYMLILCLSIFNNRTTIFRSDKWMMEFNIKICKLMYAIDRNFDYVMAWSKLQIADSEKGLGYYRWLKTFKAVLWLVEVEASKSTKSRPEIERDGLLDVDFLARDSIYAIARYMSSPVRPSVRPSVCPSVPLSLCPSHGWISQRHLKLGSRNLHHRVAPWL